MGGREPIAVVGAGLKAPGGTSVEALWEALLCRPLDRRALPSTSAFRPPPKCCGARSTGFEPSAYLTPVEVRRLDRCHHLAIGAAQDALDGVTGGPLPAADRCAVVCGVGFGATATYEAQHTRLLDPGPEGPQPTQHPDGHAQLGGGPPVAAVRLSGAVPHRVSGVRVGRRRDRRGRGAAAPGRGRPGAGRRGRRHGDLQRHLLVPAAGRHEQVRRRPGPRLAPVRRGTRRLRALGGGRLRRPAAARRRRGGRSIRPRPRARLRLERRRPPPRGAEPRWRRSPAVHAARARRRRRHARPGGARQRSRHLDAAQRCRRGRGAGRAVRRHDAAGQRGQGHHRSHDRRLRSGRDDRGAAVAPGAGWPHLSPASSTSTRPA